MGTFSWSSDKKFQKVDAAGFPAHTRRMAKKSVASHHVKVMLDQIFGEN
jgi:hypothetical protein